MLRLLILFFAAPCFVMGLVAAELSLTPPEIRGRTIYREGKGASGKSITAILSGGTEVSAMTCANCHGNDGRGRPEGGVTPPRIRWEDLSRPYEVASESGRRHGPYTERMLIRAVAMGLDAAGNRLGDAMPRFALTRSEADDLIAYLKRIAEDHDPGLSDQAIRIGAMLPPNGSAAVRSALSAYFADLNRNGGVYGRRVEMVFRDAPVRPAETPGALSAFLREEAVFALISTFIAGAEKDAVALLNQEKVPVIGAQTLLPGTNAAANPTVFYLDSGVAGQTVALADFASNQFGGADLKALFVTGADELSRAAVAGARVRLPESREIQLPRDLSLLKGLPEAPRATFLFLPEAEMLAVLRLAAQGRWQTVFLIPSAFITDAVLLECRTLANASFLAVPFLRSDITPEGAALFARLASGGDHRPAEFSALCDATILVEGLKRAGRDLSRVDLKESLEGLYDFSCGFGQPVTFSSTRHMGVEHFHVVPIKAETRHAND